MSEFDKVANNILKGLNENFINNAADAIQHRWALTIAHPGLGEEDEEFRVIDHNLTADGVIEEYYVEYKDELVSVPASEVKVIKEETHPDDEEDEADDDEDGDKEKEKEEAEEELNSIREAFGLPKKKKGPHGTKPKLNCRLVYRL